MASILSFRAAPLVRAAAIAAGLLAVACSQIPGTGPRMGGAQSFSTEALPFEVIELTAETVGPYRPQPAPQRASNVYRLSYAGRAVAAPGDILKVRVFQLNDGGLFPTPRNAGADPGLQRVNDNGTITVPFVGAVPVAGLDTGQIERRIVDMIGNKAQDAQAIVEFVVDRSNTIQVRGAVGDPGGMTILEGARSVVEVITLRGGAAGEPDHTEVVVRRNGQVILAAQYSELLAGADIAVRKGDEILVRPNPRVFSALGTIERQGNYRLTRRPMTLIEALGEIGGLADLASHRSGVFVFRLAEPQGGAPGLSKVFQLDLNQPQSLFVAQQFEVQPKDVLYIAASPMHEYNKVLVFLYANIVTYNATRAIVPFIPRLSGDVAR